MHDCWSDAGLLRLDNDTGEQALVGSCRRRVGSDDSDSNSRAWQRVVGQLDSSTPSTIRASFSQEDNFKECINMRLFLASRADE